MKKLQLATFGLVLAVAGLAGVMSANAAYTWNFSNAADYYLSGDPGVVQPGNQVQTIGATPGTPELGNPSAISYMPVITTGVGALVPARPWINFDDDAPYGSDWASVFAMINTQALLRVGDITGGGFTLSGMNHPGAVYGSLYLSPSGGSGSDVLILLSPMTVTGSGTLIYTFDLNTHADYRTRIFGVTGWSSYDPAKSGTFGDIIGMLSANTDYAAMFGPQIGLSNTSETTFTVSEIQLVPVPEPTTMIAGALLLLPFGASTIRMLRKNRKA